MLNDCAQVLASSHTSQRKTRMTGKEARNTTTSSSGTHINFPTKMAHGNASTYILIFILLQGNCVRLPSRGQASQEGWRWSGHQRGLDLHHPVHLDSIHDLSHPFYVPLLIITLMIVLVHHQVVVPDCDLLGGWHPLQPILSGENWSGDGAPVGVLVLHSWSC